jgi:SUKH-4 immunity protein
MNDEVGGLRMSPEAFLTRWRELSVRAGDDLAGLFGLYFLPAPDPRLSGAANRFLVETGIPDTNFCYLTDLEGGLKRIDEVYDVAYPWPEAARREVEPYLIVGHTQGGDPVCLDLSQNEQLIIAYYMNFGIDGETFINSSVAQFAESVLIFHSLLVDYFTEFSSDAPLLEGKVPSEWVERARAAIREVDPPAIADNTCWTIELDGL